MKSFSLAVLLILGLALTGCSWNPFHKMYSATALMQIRFEPLVDGRPLYDAHQPVVPDRIATFIEVLEVPENLTSIIVDLKLDKSWAVRFKAESGPLTPKETLDHLRKVLKMEAVPGTNIIKITASSEVPQEAANIVNALVDHYKALRDQERAVQFNRGVDFLRGQVTQQQKVVDDAKATVEKARQNLSSIGPTLPNEHKDPMTPYRDAQRDLIQQQSLLDSLNVRLKEVIADETLEGSPVRIISRAVPPPE